MAETGHGVKMERQIMTFTNPAQFDSWLEANGAHSAGVWLRIAKKGSGLESVSYAQALDCALCHGWIDGQKDKLDDKSWLQYFCKRKKTSLWSAINKQHIDRLAQAGLMRKAGLEAVEEAKVSGQWDRAYQAISSREIPAELETALRQNPKAREFFEALDSQNRFAFVFRVQTAKKPETNAKRVAEFMRMLENGEMFYPKH